MEEDDYYDLSVIFGNSNDGSTRDDRDFTAVRFSLDGQEQTLYFPNTIKSEYTDKLTFTRYFEKGSHTISLAHKKGTFVLDSMLVVW